MEEEKRGESIIQCLAREVYEETSQIIENPKLSCLYKVFIPRINREITGVTFYTELKDLKKFLANEEINKINLWDMESNIGEIDEIDRSIVEFVMENIKGE